MRKTCVGELRKPWTELIAQSKLTLRMINVSLYNTHALTYTHTHTHTHSDLAMEVLASASELDVQLEQLQSQADEAEATANETEQLIASVENKVDQVSRYLTFGGLLLIQTGNAKMALH